MKIAIVGCRDGEYLYDQMQKNASSRYEVVCFADNNVKLHNTEIAGKKVCSMAEMADRYTRNEIQQVIIAVRKGYSRFCIIEQLKKMGVHNILLLKPSPLTFRLPITFDETSQLYNKQWLDLAKSEKPIIHHLEVNVADGCNLNCRGCLHFSNLYKADDFPNLDELIGTIEQISKHCEVFQFRVLGGEPLLNPELEDFLIRLRALLPNSDIAVISNGILVPRMNNQLYQVMNENYIGFNLTLYAPTLKIKEQIYKTLDDNGVAYGSHEAKTDQFEKFIMLEPSYDSKAYEVCEPRGILVVKGKEIFRCPIEAYIGKFYETYGIVSQWIEGIDAFNYSGNWNNLICDLYTKPRDLCVYCSEKSEFYEWSNGKPEMEDWLVSGK